MITTVNQVSSAWFDNKLVRKSLHNETNFNKCEFTKKFCEFINLVLSVQCYGRQLGSRFFLDFDLEMVDFTVWKLWDFGGKPGVLAISPRDPQSYMNLLAHYLIEEIIRLRDVTMIFKCLNGLVPSYLSTKYVKHSETHSYCTRQNNQFNLPQCRTSAAQCAFCFRASKYWNSLPNDIRNSASTEVFKKSAMLEIIRRRK